MYRSRLILFAALMAMMAATCFASGFTVVIDPGHGGRDMGACGMNTCEKHINLDVALRLGKLIGENDDVRVVYTRTADVAVDLYQRAACANEHKADLFISIHCNSMGRNTASRHRVKGAVTYVMGLDVLQDNLEVAHRENSVTSMEEDFTTRYQAFDVNSPESHIIFQLNQQQHMNRSLEFAQEVQRCLVEHAGRVDAGVHQAGFIVLAQATMPAILIEIDFISNPECEEFMSSPHGAHTIAQAIASALNNYRSHHSP